MRPLPGDLLRIDGDASVRLAGDRALTLRVVSVGPELTYTGWIWPTGHVIDRRGQAVARREIFVQVAGLRRATEPTTTIRRRIQRRSGARPRVAAP